MQKWIVNGISGCGRIELLNELKAFGDRNGKKICVHDVGELIFRESKRLHIPVTDERILDMDLNQLNLLRTLAIRDVESEILKHNDIDLHLIGTHATFRWKSRLIPGISYQDILEIKPNGFINVIHNVKQIFECNQKNKKWDSLTLPGLEETQSWLMEEEFITEVLANVINVPMYNVARDHKIENLSDLFFSQKKKIYLSYPITAIQEAHPDLLEQVQGPILSELEELFIVFNPLTIQDMTLADPKAGEKMPELINQLTPEAKEMIKKRTIERDFQFIDQSDAIVVFYLTDKLSPGVLAEIFYAHRNQKPVFMVFAEKKSPFIEEVTTVIEPTKELLMERLREFAKT
jgi:adenylate kinase/nucleoside 2-deoxyribosyltransferase